MYTNTAMVNTNEILPHPRNGEFFRDIADTHPELWTTFVLDVRQNGIREPLEVNQETGLLLSGHQRLRAAIECGIEQVPVTFVRIPAEKEIQHLTSVNMLRREDDPIHKYKWVQYLRSAIENNQIDNGQLSPRDFIAKTLQVSARTVQAADIFNALPQEKQVEMIKWIHEQANIPTASEIELITKKMRDSDISLQAALADVERLKLETANSRDEKMKLQQKVDTNQALSLKDQIDFCNTSFESAITTLRTIGDLLMEHPDTTRIKQLTRVIRENAECMSDIYAKFDHLAEVKAAGKKSEKPIDISGTPAEETPSIDLANDDFFKPTGAAK
jgi:hypothetical protein